MRKNQERDTTFQFHKGTIKARFIQGSFALLTHFNSIKVQLKQIWKSSVRIYTRFQFHKGTIKALRLRYDEARKIDFNSIKVQLKPLVFGYIISLFSTGFANAKLRNLIKKMSMGNYIFSCVLRQPLFLRCYNKSNS